VTHANDQILDRPPPDAVQGHAPCDLTAAEIAHTQQPIGWQSAVRRQRFGERKWKIWAMEA